MKTDKNRTRRKDWQKADARVLGQILAAQNIEFALPDTTHIADFFAETLMTVPGILSCRVCLDDVIVQKGEMESGICEECQASRKKANEQEEHPSFKPDFRCGLANRPSMQFTAINSLNHHFGFFVFQIDDSNAFNIYRPFIGNLANYVAISLENRLQRDLLQKAHDELERKVEERTQNLVATNIHLQEEIEIRRQTEEALRVSEKQIKQLIDASPIAMIVSSGIEEHIESVNDKFIELFGYTIEDIPDAAHWWPLAYPDEKYREEIKTQWQTKVEQSIGDKNEIEPVEATVVCKDGSHRYVEFRLSSVSQKHIVTFVDLTERKRAEEALRRLNRELRAISNCNQTLLRAVDEPSLVKEICRIICNEAGYAMSWVGYAEHDVAKTVRPVAWAGMESEFIADAAVSWAEDKEIGNGPAGIAIRNGEIICIQDFATDLPIAPWREILLQRGFRSSIVLPLKDENANVFGVLSIYSSEVNAITSDEIRLMDELSGDLAFGIITLRTRAEREQAERGLRESEERSAAAFHASPNLIAITRFTDGTLLDVNDGYSRLLGYSRAESIGKTTAELSIWANAADRITFINSLNNFGQITDFETTLRRKDGTVVTVIDSARIIKLQGETCVLSVIHDITERKQHENEREVIIQISKVLRAANTRAEMLPILLDQVNDMFHADGAAVTMSRPITDGPLIELGRGTYGEKFTGLTISPGEGMSGRVIDSGKPYLCNDMKADPTFAFPELLGEANAIACAPLIAHELTIGALWIIRTSDITEGELRLLVGIADIAANAIQRVTLYEQTERQLHLLIALHQIDMTISASLDLTVTLDLFLGSVITQLGVDAADILLLTPHTQTLAYSASIGFWTRQIEKSQIRLGEGQAGVAASQRRVVSLPDLEDAREKFSRPDLLAEEKFVSHSVAPLIVKGQIKGVLEVFTRKRLDPTKEWLDFFETMATQAAIAIDNATLFDDLQRSNIELKLAYDATIEGWSRALDLRDKETEGHTQRVTEMTLRLATKFELSNMEKLELRRGALLHDIGKMGVPDAILLKPGELTEAEWAVMRLHPTYAYQMLEPISYLRGALDIPYCHHEKWDGSGYPRGLIGEQIPLAARIFAVVDVFDALVYDRPYRPAWSKADVHQYIREQAGKHFDPDVVSAFLEMQQDS